jgi:hypothetical protein
MAHAIRVDSRFATAHDTARILGVSKSRTAALIKIAKRYTDRILGRDSKTDHKSEQATDAGNKGHRSRKSATTVARVRKNSGRDAVTKNSATKTKKAKAAH